MEYQINKNISHWLISKTYEETMEFQPVTMTGKMNQWMLEGFAIHENPSRQEYVRKRQAPPYPEPVMEEMSLYLPWDNPNVENSGFWFTPTHLSTWAMTWIKAETFQEEKWLLKTCGAATVYVNGRQVADFAPFTRNLIQKQEILFPLNQGLNEVCVFFEDIAERDTQYLFRLDYLGEQTLTIELPIEQGEKIRQLEQAMQMAYLKNDTTATGSFELMIANPLPEEIEYQIVIHPQDILGDDKNCQISGKLPEKARMICVPKHMAELPVGFCSVRLSLFYGEWVLTRGYSLQSYVLEGKAEQREGMEQRRQKALDYIAKYGNNDIFRAIALLKKCEGKELAQKIIVDFTDRIRNRHDCSDFYLAGLIYLWQEYGATGLWTEEEKREIKTVILGFRYWMEEPGNDVMWFFSENHALLFHVCELLAGEIFTQDIFPNSGFTGEEHRQLAGKRLDSWFESFFAEGITEWNSSAYVPIDALGFLALYLMTNQEKYKKLAKRGLDALFFDLAVFGKDGVLSCTFGRSYEKELKGNYIAGTSMMMALGWGKGFYNQSGIVGTFLALSDYQPPQYQRYREIPEKKALVFQRQQGFQDYVKVSAYKTQDYILSCAYDFRPGQLGYQQNVLHAYFSPTALIWINHPGERHLHGSGRPNFWAGNGRLPRAWQYRGVAGAIYQLQAEDEIDYTHAYFPVSEFDEIRINGNWVYAKAGKAFVGVYAAAGLRLQTSGPNQNRELISEGRNNLWLLRVGNQAEYRTFDDFIQKNSYTVKSQGSQYDFQDSVYGAFHVRFEGENLHNNNPMEYQAMDEIIDI